MSKVILTRQLSKYEDLNDSIKKELAELTIAEEGMPSMFQQSINAGFNPKMLLAKRDGKVIGWTADFVYKDEDGFPFNYFTGFKRMFYVTPTERLKGIGKRLGVKAEALTKRKSMIAYWDIKSEALARSLERERNDSHV